MMNYLKLIVFTFLLLLPVQAFAGHHDIPLTDEASDSLFSFIDLRDRESYVQVTNTDSTTRTVHVQIFNVDQNCNENNFFDVYTPNDTHVYNMRDILTNDGNPSGVVLPENAYGIVAISIVDSNGNIDSSEDFLIGNFRILDDQGYEYRTNSSGDGTSSQAADRVWYFNFNTKGGVSLSDIIFIAVDEQNGEWLAGPSESFWVMDVDIFNLDEVPFSCRNVIFSCVDADNPLLDALLAGAFTRSDDDDSSPPPEASVAAFEYGINEAIPHSKGGELLCPGNVISEGWVTLENGGLERIGDSVGGFVGLNNGNGRGSMDSLWQQNYRTFPSDG